MSDAGCPCGWMPDGIQPHDICTYSAVIGHYHYGDGGCVCGEAFPCSAFRLAWKLDQDA